MWKWEGFIFVLFIYTLYLYTDVNKAFLFPSIITQISPFPSLIAALPLTNVECDYLSKLLPVKCDWLAQASQAQVEQEGAGTTWDSGLSHGEPPQDGTLPFYTPVVP